MAAVTKLSIIRLFELVVVCVLIGLHFHSFGSGSITSQMLTSGTIVGYLIILAGLLAAALMGTPVNRRVDLFFSVVGCILFIIIGGLSIDWFKTNNASWNNNGRDIGLAKGSICIIEAILFLADTIFTFRGEA